MKIIAVIPARWQSQRFPGKPLAELCGRPLIYWPWRRACQCELIDEVCVATDDERIFQAVEQFGGIAVMTSPDAVSGSDRIAEVARARDCDVIVNVQGDEPDISPHTLKLTIRGLLDSPDCAVSTAMVAISAEADFLSRDAVKVVCDSRGRALYFSRSPIPNRSRSQPQIVRELNKTNGTDATDVTRGGREAHAAREDGAGQLFLAGVWGYKHLGLYVYRREALLEFTGWPPAQLEQLEKLEQLRFLEHGRQIAVVETPYDSIGVDTPEELERARIKIVNYK